MDTLQAENYCILKSTTPSEICQKIYDYTKSNHENWRMLIGPLEGSLLGFLVELVRAKNILEIGTFTGYSAMTMAERLPSDGKLMTLDIDEKTVEIAKKYWAQSPHGKKIESILGPGLETMKRLSGPFDLIFIDADKENYSFYFQRALELLSPNGIIVVDNCLWDGKVYDSSVQEASTIAIRELNELISQMPGISSCLLPVRDGVFLVRKRT